MRGVFFRSIGGVGLLLGLAASGLRAAQERAGGDVIELQKLRIDERGLGRTYYYAEVPGFELLSPFSEKLTQAYARELQRQRALLSVFLPEAADSNYAVPQPIFLDDQPPLAGKENVLIGRTHMLIEGVVRQSIAAIRGVPIDPGAKAKAGGRATLTWSHAAAADTVVSYTSIFGFDYARQSGKSDVVAAERGLSHVFPMAALYEHRRPRWPTWLEDGLDMLGARFYSEQTLQFFMLIKLAPPPTDLTVEALFAPPRRDESVESARMRRQGACVFVHWALIGGELNGMLGPSPRRDAFWRFANAAITTPVTEEMFVRHFGGDAWDDLLRMWSSCANYQLRARVPQTLGTYWPEQAPTFREVPVRKATRAELVRVKSEYEWRIGREFAAALPELERQCLDQAGRRLRHAYADGERDPRFLAVLALFEADVGSPEDARRLIDEAAATGVVRPLLYYHQARQRYLETKAKLPTPEGKFTLEQTRWMLAPLEVARTQRPALKEVYLAMVEFWSRCVERPDAGELEKLREGARLFPHDLALGYHVGLLLARGGERAAAETVLTEALTVAPEGGETRRALQELLAAVRGATTGDGLKEPAR